MITVLEGEGQLLWGFHSVNYSWHLVPTSGPLLGPAFHFHWRLHKLMVVIHTPRYPPCRAFSLAGNGFSFFFSFSPGISQCIQTYSYKVEHIFCSPHKIFMAQWYSFKNCITDFKSIKVMCQLLRSLSMPPVCSASKPPLPPKTPKMSNIPVNPPETGKHREAPSLTQHVCIIILQYCNMLA